MILKWFPLNHSDYYCCGIKDKVPECVVVKEIINIWRQLYRILSKCKRLVVPRASMMQHRADLHNKTQNRDINARSAIENKSMRTGSDLGSS